MGSSSGANNHHLHHHPPMGVLPARQHPRPAGLQTSLSLASSGPAGSPDTLEPRSQDSPTESASSLGTWPIETNLSDAIASKKIDKEKEGENEVTEPQVIHRVSAVNRLSLREVARESVEMVREKMKLMPDDLLEGLKSELRMIFEGTGGSHHIEEFLYLQKLVQGRVDLTAKNLVDSHCVQLEILVAINTGIQAFLHPSIASIPQSSLIEVFLHKRCRNFSCQSALPADGCSCKICSSKKGFCNLCMCVICNKFDFEINTCRWIGCDVCSHWTHTDCAIRSGKILTGQSVKSGVQYAEMLFKCIACHRSSDLLGWVKDVFQHCALGWEKEVMMRELDFVSKIFCLNEDPRGKKLYWKCTELIEKLKSGTTESMACRLLMLFLQELELDSPKNSEAKEAGRVIAPQEAFNQIAEVVREAITKMEMVAEAKMRTYKRARVALEPCDRELEEKAREVAELKMERQRKKQQIDELESIIRLKQAEVDMFQLKADEAKQEVKRLQSMALTKSEKAEQDYASLYLKRRLDEAEGEKQYLFEKMKRQESQSSPQTSTSAGGDSSLMLSKIQNLLKNVYSLPPKSEGQHPK